MFVASFTRLIKGFSALFSNLLIRLVKFWRKLTLFTVKHQKNEVFITKTVNFFYI